MQKIFLENKLLLLALVGFVLTFLSYRLGVAYNSILIVYAVFQVSARNLAAILVLLLGYVNFAGRATFAAYGLEHVETNIVMIGGIGLGSILLLNVALPAVVFLNMLKGRLAANHPVVVLLLLAWFVWCVGAGGSSLWGMSLGYNGWADPARSALFGATIFYGGMLHRRHNISGELQKLYYVILFCTLACFAGHFYHRLIFISVAIMPYWSLWRFFSLKHPLAKLTSLVGFMSSGAVAFGITLGGLNSTFTLKGLWALSFLGYIFFEILRGKRMKNMLTVVPISAYVLTSTFLVFVISFGYKLRVGSRSLHESTPFFERLQAKIFDDRLFVWDAVYNQFASGFNVFNIAGEPMALFHVVKGDILVTFGSHNIMLDLIRKSGYLGFLGAMALIVISLCISMRVFQHLTGAERALVWGSFITLVYGGLSGHYPLAQNAIFWVLLPLGFGLRFYLKDVERQAHPIKRV